MANLQSNKTFPELKNHSAFNSGQKTLEELMLKGEANEKWNDICEKVGELLATTRNTFNVIDVAQVFENVSINKRSVLGQWVEKVNNSWDEAVKPIIPAGRPIHLDTERLNKRGKQVVELLEKGGCINLDNLVTNQSTGCSDKFQRNGTSLWSTGIGDGYVFSGCLYSLQ